MNSNDMDTRLGHLDQGPRQQLLAVGVQLDADDHRLGLSSGHLGLQSGAVFGCKVENFRPKLVTLGVWNSYKEESESGFWDSGESGFWAVEILRVVNKFVEK